MSKYTIPRVFCAHLQFSVNENVKCFYFRCHYFQTIRINLCDVFTKAQIFCSFSMKPHFFFQQSNEWKTMNAMKKERKKNYKHFKI